MPGGGRLRLCAQRHSRTTALDCGARRLQRWQVLELAGFREIGGGFPVPRTGYQVAAADVDFDPTPARTPEVSGRGEFGERDCGNPWPERENRGSAQIQPYA